MGNFTNMIIVFACIGLVAGMLVIMSQDLSTESGVAYDSQFFGDYLFSKYDVSTMFIHGSQTSTTDWGVDKTSLGESDLPSQSVTGSSSSGASASSTQFPDWLKSGLNWITSPFTTVIGGVATGVNFFLNVVGIPYTIIKAINPDARILASISGALSVIIFIIWVMFILGREN